MTVRRFMLAVALLSGTLAGVPASAAQRTFVASFGNDANNCSLPQPCRTFTAAMANTDPNGEVLVLDSAGYGSVTITQSVSIIAPAGVYAGISVFPGTDGVTINGAGAEVTLRGLAINGQGGIVGISMLQGQSLAVENCTVTNMFSDGIRVAADANVAIRDTVLRASGGRGIHVTAGTVLLDRVRVEGTDQENLRVRAETADVRVHVRDSVLTLAVGDGIFVTNAGTLQSRVVVEGSSVLRSGGLGVFVIGIAPGFATATLLDSTVSDHASTGINTQGSAGTAVRISGTTVRGNGGNSLLQGGSASFITFGNNAVVDNAFGSSGVITLQALQ